MVPPPLWPAPPLPIPDTLKGVDELIHAGLESYRDSCFNWLLAATGLVIIGLALEGPELWHEIRSMFWHWRFRRKFNFSLPEEHTPNWKKLLAFTGWVLIVAGVAGEYVADSFVSRADGFVQKFDEILLAETTNKSNSAVADAVALAGRFGGLHEFVVANEQQIDAQFATFRRYADDESKQTAAVITELNSDREKLDKSRTEAVAAASEAKQALAKLRLHRTIINESALVSALLPFDGTEYTLTVAQDDEAFELTRKIDRVLQAAKWVRKQPERRNIGITYFRILSNDRKDDVGLCVDTGVHIDVLTKESVAALNGMPTQHWPRNLQAGLALRNSLSPNIAPADDHNVGQELIDPTPGEGPIVICVGKKP